MSSGVTLAASAFRFGILAIHLGFSI